jgi:hypothetical protein
VVSINFQQDPVFEPEGLSMSVEAALSVLENSLTSPLESQQMILDCLAAGKPFNLVRIGDIEAQILCLKNCSWDRYESILEKVWFCGVEPSFLPDPDQFADYLRHSDLVGCTHPQFERNTHFMYPLIEGLSKNNLLTTRRFIEVHSIYHLAAEGSLFKALAGKRVVLVGGKVLPFYHYYYQNADYRKHFPNLCLEDLQIVGVIPTPDFPVLGFKYWDFTLKTIRQNYARLNPDVFLLSSGLLAKYLSYFIKEDGYTALNVGNTFESLMNWLSKRPGTEAFHEYVHPEYDFEFNEMSGLGCIIPKSNRLT